MQAGQINSFGNNQPLIINNFMQGPSLVRGFAPAGIGPRDISNPFDIQSAALGGTTYYGGSAEVDFPIFGLPREIGLKGAVFADAGNLIGYSGPTNFSNFLGYTYCPTPGSLAAAFPITQSSCANVYDPNLIRTSVGVSLIWASPMGPIRFDFALPDYEGQVRPDAVLQLLRRHDVLKSTSRLRHQTGAPGLARPSSLLTEPRNWPEYAFSRRVQRLRWLKSQAGAARRSRRAPTPAA